MRRLTISLVMLVAIVALAGCGQKGPLLRPTPSGQPAPGAAQPSSQDTHTLPTPASSSGG